MFGSFCVKDRTSPLPSLCLWFCGQTVHSRAAFFLSLYVPQVFRHLMFTLTAPCNINNMHSCYCPPLYHSAFLYCNLACNHAIQLKRPSRLLSIEDSFCTFTCTKRGKKTVTFLSNADFRFNWKVHFTADKWTVQSIYAIITGFRFSFIYNYCDFSKFCYLLHVY